MPVNGIKSITVLVYGIANRIGTVPEGRVEHIDIFVNERLLILFKKIAELGDHLWNIGGEIVHG
jgi:hypothetical protein